MPVTARRSRRHRRIREIPQPVPQQSFETVRSAGGVLETTLRLQRARSRLREDFHIDGLQRPVPGRRFCWVTGRFMKLHLGQQPPEERVHDVALSGTSTSRTLPATSILHVNPADSYDYRIDFAPDHDRDCSGITRIPRQNRGALMGGMSGVAHVEGFLRQSVPRSRQHNRAVVMLKALEGQEGRRIRKTSTQARRQRSPSGR